MSERAGIDPEGGEAHRAIVLRIPARPEYVALCRLALIGIAQARPISADVLADLKLALTEAVSNSVRHAYRRDGTGHVDIRYELGRDRIRVEVADDGEGFDPDQAPSFDGEGLVEGGLGIVIIRTIADELEIESKPGVRGSRLRLMKLLS